MVCANDCPSPWKPSGNPQIGDDSYCASTTVCVGLRRFNHYYIGCKNDKGQIQVWKYCNSEWGNCC